MATTSIPVDVLNPGQVFACLGLMELSEELLGGTSAGFDWREPDDVRFVLRADGDDDPVAAALRFVVGAQVSTLAPYGSSLDTESWGMPTRTLTGGSPFPAPLPPKVATLPAVLMLGERTVTIASWADVSPPGYLTTKRDNVKFWAGAQGKPGASFVRDALDLARLNIEGVLADPFNFAAPQGGSLRFDWRRDYIALDIGFSLNEHKPSMRSCGYPLVEVLAAIGLTHARPHRVKKLLYRYAIAGRDEYDHPEGNELLPPTLLRAVLGGAALPFPTRTFTMQLNWPGKKGQARCITTVSEEMTP